MPEGETSNVFTVATPKIALSSQETNVFVLKNPSIITSVNVKKIIVLANSKYVTSLYTASDFGLLDNTLRPTNLNLNSEEISKMLTGYGGKLTVEVENRLATLSGEVWKTQCFNYDGDLILGLNDTICVSVDGLGVTYITAIWEEIDRRV